MAPSTDVVFHVTCDNMYEGDLSADALGIKIPRLCYHPDLSILGACRVCLVEVEGHDVGDGFTIGLHAGFHLPEVQ